MGKSSPTPPDPWETAQAQGQMNRETAIAQQHLNMVNQRTPWGTLTYNRVGTWGDDPGMGQTAMGQPTGGGMGGMGSASSRPSTGNSGADKILGFFGQIQDAKDSGEPVRLQGGSMSSGGGMGSYGSLPRYESVIELSPEQQAIFDQSQAAQLNLAELGNQQSEWLKSYLAEPFSFDNRDAENWAYDLGSQRLDPRFEQQKAALETQLVNKGIRPGTAAWNAEMSRLGETENDAYNQLMLQGRSQAFNEALAQRNQPLNEIIGLMSGSQVQNPSSTFTQTPQTGVAGVDYTGLVNNQYQAELANHQSKMGGLFGLGSALIGAMPFSDRRLKTDIKRVGATDDGTPIYTYRYKTGGPVMMGVMAQDVPAARVMDPSGFYRVDYSKVH